MARRREDQALHLTLSFTHDLFRKTSAHFGITRISGWLPCLSRVGSAFCAGVKSERRIKSRCLNILGELNDASVHSLAAFRGPSRSRPQKPGSQAAAKCLQDFNVRAPACAAPFNRISAR